MDENKPRRRWLSFGIRDLLWAMMVLGLALGLLSARQEATYHRARADWWNREVTKRRPFVNTTTLRHYEFDEANREVVERPLVGSMSMNR